MQPNEVDYNRLLEMMNKIKQYPESIKQKFPPILKMPNSIITQSTEDFLLLVFVSKEDLQRIRRYKEKNVNPFPGLILQPNEKGRTALALNSNQKFYLVGNSVSNLYSIKLGKDCSVVIQNHSQSIKTKGFGAVQYTIDLGYLISYGSEITKQNVLDYLNDLIAYSINIWSQQH